MDENIWMGQAPEDDLEDDYDEDAPIGAPVAFVNGATLTLEAGASFKDTVLRLAREAGYGKFKVFLNGSELRVSEAPAIIESGIELKITPFDSAA